MDWSAPAEAALFSLNQSLNDMADLIHKLHTRQTATEKKLCVIKADNGINATEDLADRLRALGVANVQPAWRTREDIESSNREVVETFAKFQKVLRECRDEKLGEREKSDEWQEAEMKRQKQRKEQMNSGRKDFEERIADAEEDVSKSKEEMNAKTAEKRTMVWQERLDLAEMKKLMEMVTALGLNELQAEIENERETLTKKDIREMIQALSESLVKIAGKRENKVGKGQRVKHETDETDETDKGSEKPTEEVDESMEKLALKDENDGNNGSGKEKEATKARSETTPPSLSQSSDPRPLRRPLFGANASDNPYFIRRGSESYDEIEGRTTSDEVRTIYTWRRS